MNPQALVRGRAGELGSLGALMSRDDWYRRKTWTDADRTDFFERLHRSRGESNKAQYARIQASYLQREEPLDLVLAASELLDIVLRDYPANSELAQTYLQKAECDLRLRGSDQAFWWLRKALQFEHEYPNALTQAYLRFAELVLVEDRRELFDEALAILHENEGRVMFPRDVYIFHAAHAVILESRGERQAAREHARAAVRAGGAEHSGFARHPKVGLVTKPLEGIHEQIIELAGT